MLFYLDNEGSRFSLIKGYASSWQISIFCNLILADVDDNHIIPWFGRVASLSNVADRPSRNKNHALLPFVKEVSVDIVRKALDECILNIFSFSFAAI